VATLQPQTPATQALPFVLPVQLTQLVPQPWVTVSAVHEPPTQHVALPHVPSPVVPQALVHVPPAPHVGVAPEHAVHAPPPAPQAPLPVPAPHVPVSGLQQPPLHAVSLAPPQAAPQVCVLVLHASPAGQSLATLHPHVVLPMHALPAPLPMQLTQEAPQAIAPMVTQELPWQHVPPPHVPFPDPPHALTHVPPAQVGVAFAQPAHVPPDVPQALLAVPATHCAASGSQHPPLQAVWFAPPQAALQV